MNTLNKERLLKDLKSKEFRQIFYAEHISTALPMQTRELRKQRGLSQAALAALIGGTDQKNISDWENPNYEYKPQIGTLMRLADAFDVPLIVRFGSWEELWDWENNLSPERLAPRKFDDALPELEMKIKDEAALSGKPDANKQDRAGTRGSLRAVADTTPKHRRQIEQPPQMSLRFLELIKSESSGGKLEISAEGKTAEAAYEAA